MPRVARKAFVIGAAGAAAALLIGTLPGRAGAARFDPDKVQVVNELSTRNVGAEECGLACLITDAVRDAAGTNAAFMAASAFTETTIPRGTATPNDVLKALAFRTDSVSIVRLKGSQIRQALERGVELYPQRRSAFLHVSGITANIDPSADAGRRVSSIRVGKSDLVDSKIYTVAMPAPLADGALTYYKVWSKADIDREHDPGITLEDAVTRYLAGRRSIGERNEERLVFKK